MPQVLPDKANTRSATLPGAATVLIGVGVKLLVKLLHLDPTLADPITDAAIAVGVVLMALGGRRVAGQIVKELKAGNECAKKGDGNA
jgi:hypothetical protein